MDIRKEEPRDYNSIYAVVKAAFDSADGSVAAERTVARYTLAVNRRYQKSQVFNLTKS